MDPPNISINQTNTIHLLETVLCSVLLMFHHATGALRTPPHTSQQRLSDLIIGLYQGTYGIAYRVLQPLSPPAERRVRLQLGLAVAAAELLLEPSDFLGLAAELAR